MFGCAEILVILGCSLLVLLKVEEEPKFVNLKRAPGQESRRVDPYCETFINLIELQQVVDLTISKFKETSHHRFHHCIYFLVS